MPDNNLVFSSQWNRPRGPPLPTWIPRRMSDLRTAIRGVDTAIQELVKPKKLIYSATAAQDTKCIFWSFLMIRTPLRHRHFK